MKTIQLLFILMLVLIVVVYYVGSTNILQTGGSVLNQAGNTFTGRTQDGTFANYPH
jgi:hypothetical protein